MGCEIIAPSPNNDCLLDPPATHWFWGIAEEYRLCHIVGYFFDKMARHLLKESKISFEKWLNNIQINPDLVHKKLRCHFEFKGSSNMDPFIIYDNQFNSLLKILGFPIDDHVTWFFSYRNKGSKNNEGKRERLLKNHKSQREVFEFLAKQTNAVYAVHHTLLDGMRMKNGTTQQHFRNFQDNREIISINRTGLKLATQNTRETLVSLGLSDEIPRWLPPRAKSIHTRMVETKIGGHHVKFKLFILLPNGLKMRFLRHLNGVVKETLD